MIIDLERFCGLDVKLETDVPKLVFGKGISWSNPAVRTIEQMEEVLLSKEIYTPPELYYMYRDIHRLDDYSLLKEQHLRYDLTVIKPDSLGKEFMKTAGHYHPDNFPELYEVVSGHAFCLLQRPNSSDYRIIEEVILVEAVEAEKIVIPPGFGHILINPGPDNLVTANWVSSEFSSQYQLYKKAQGAVYFFLASDKLELVKNSHFRQIPPVRFVKPQTEIPKFGLIKGKPIYSLIKEEAGALSFLNHPLDYDYGDVFVDKI
ncbi:MAG: glucose-6-phosphate isomerase [Candidatus Omnitrophica bacterium]|nr:glucose-6-phosphate isomerase [Candidatus Omnitrophota bacterium]